MWVCLVLVLFARLAEILWMGIAGIVIMVLGMGQTIFFCKCPYCGSNFNIRAKLPKFCRRAGSVWKTDFLKGRGKWITESVSVRW